MRTSPVSLCASIVVAAGGHDGAHVAGARAQLEPVGRALRRGARRRPLSELARSEKPQKPVARDRRPTPVLICTEARTPARSHGAAGGLDRRAGRCRARSAGSDARQEPSTWSGQRETIAQRAVLDAAALSCDGAPEGERGRRGGTSTAVRAAVDLHVGVAHVQADAREVAEHAVGRGARLARDGPPDREQSPRPRSASTSAEAATSHHQATVSGAQGCVAWDAAPAPAHLP